MAPDSPVLDTSQLAATIQAADPSARLVPARYVRRLIRRRYGLSSKQRMPHDFGFDVSREELLECISASDVGGGPLPERILLLPLPDSEEKLSFDEALVIYWRRLFHAAVDRAVEREGGGFDEDPVLFNATVRHEIRAVLQQDMRLLEPDNDRELYREFVALLLELEYFVPGLLDAYFPGFLKLDDVTRLLENRYHTRTLLESTRPTGAVNPLKSLHKPASSTSIELPATDEPPDAATVSEAVEARELGNDVRAALLNRELGYLVEAEEHLRHLVERLRTPLHFEAAATGPWFEALRPLLDEGCRGYWPPASRLLFELQKACLDVERNVYSIDAIEWLVTFGKQPIKRLLDKPREVNVLRRLRTAARLLRRTHLRTSQRDLLDHLLHHAMAEIEARVRRDNRPVLNEVLDEVGLIPSNQAERCARHKIVEELLDVLCARGFLKMSDLRDTIARNRLKLNDLAGPLEFFFGDPVIQANRKLAIRMDGIYRRGEIYMRALQRGSSLAFGTALGRLLVLWLILPFGGAYVILEGLHHFVEAIEGLTRFVVRHVIGGPPSEHAAARGDPWMTSIYAIAAFGLFLIGMIHWPRFRRRVGLCTRIAFWDIPRATLNSAWLHAVYRNPAVRFMLRYLFVPFLVGGSALIGMRFLDFEWEYAITVGCGFALLTGTFFRTRWGQGLEERMDETMARIWKLISVNFLIGILTAVLSFFQKILELIDKGTYAVDEWLRFREGQSALSYVFKVLFGIVWFFVTYVFRFAWNLLIEPQINPIKHFPVVTVSHKLLLPLIPSLSESFNMPISTTTTVVFCIPGIFGFLVWELKENWKLYKANGAKHIKPAVVGSHGERVRGLLRPGLHSGVIPKTFAKLRRAEFEDNHARAIKYHHKLDHAAEAIHWLAEREFAACLMASQRWGGLPIHVEPIRLATNRVRIPLTIQPWAPFTVISIEERGGWLISSIEQTGWLGVLSEKQRSAFQDALLGLYKLAGVHVVREQAAEILGVDAWRIDCRPEGLLVQTSGPGLCVKFDYTDEELIMPTGLIDGRAVQALPKSELVLSDNTLVWDDWVRRWEEDRDGKSPVGMLVRQKLL